MQNRSFAPWPLFVLYTHQNCVRVNELGRLIPLLMMFGEYHRKDQRQTGKGNVVYWKIYHFHFQAINSVFWAQCDKGQMCSGETVPKGRGKSLPLLLSVCLCRSAEPIEIRVVVKNANYIFQGG